MAQVVGYFQDNPVFTEGPFVIVYANGWRIEVEQKGHHCPVMVGLSVGRIVERLGLQGKTNDRAKAEAVCDNLNQMVRSGEIVLNDVSWVDSRSVLQARETAERVLGDVQ